MSRKRNNELRVGSKGTAPASPIPQLGTNENTKPGFSFAVPTEIVELPSGGRHYPDGHPLSGVDTVEIRYMTAKDEDILTSKTLLNKGVALDRFLNDILIDKSIEINSLLVGDKNAILLASRITGYGSLYETKVQCPSCGSASDYTFNLNFCSIDDSFEVSELEDNVKSVGTGVFSTTLPTTGLEVKFKLLSGYDQELLTSRIKTSKDIQKHESTVTSLFKTIIVSINDSTDSHAMWDFIDKMPARDSKYLRNLYESVSPDIDMKQTFVCEHCGAESRLEVPLSAEFFWPK